MRTYFVAYAFSGKRASGNGMISVTAKNGISSFRDIEGVADHIKMKLVERGTEDPTVVVINWKEIDPDPVESKSGPQEEPPQAFHRGGGVTPEERHAIAWKIFRRTASPEEMDAYNAALTKELQDALPGQIERAQPAERKECDT